MDNSTRYKKRIMFQLSALIAFLSVFFSIPVFISHAQGNDYSLRFYGNGVNDIDRVKIQIDAPAVSADIGSSDFTLEFWMKANPGDNSAGNCPTGKDNWIRGNIIIDRDVFGGGDYGDYGISLYSDGIAFGVVSGSSGAGICGTTDVADGQWHHVAVTWRITDGLMRLYVDGWLEAEFDGPDGDISYRDGRSTSYANDPFLVIGAEKHDEGPAYPSFSGWIDEVRLSTNIRYSTDFTPPSQAFQSDANTAALYHFDEGQGDVVNDSSGAAGGPSNGVRRFGGSPAGPVWSEDSPFSISLSADLVLSKTVDNSTPHEGDTIIFTVTVTNNGPAQVTNVSLDDVLPAGLTAVAIVPSQGSYTLPTWMVGALNSGGLATLTLQATVDAGTGGSQITNTVTRVSLDQTDSNATVDDMIESISVNPAGNPLITDLVISKTVDDSTPNEGDTITFTVAVTNNGLVQATNVSLDDALPTGLTADAIVVSQGIYSVPTWTVGALNSGALAKLTLQATVDAGTGGSDITNTVTSVKLDQADSNTTADDVTESILVNRQSNTSITNSSGGGGGGCFISVAMPDF